MSDPIEFVTPVGRLVGGHPMKRAQQMDEKTRMPKVMSDGSPLLQSYIGVAIPKAGEQHWHETGWGARIWAKAQQDWPNGEFNMPTFAWKIVDGDSAIPNRAGNKPCEREGYPGHWVLNLQTALSIKCYHVGKYQPHEQIQNENEIKPGDYCRVNLNVKGNGPSQSPGMYLNPTLFELSRAGQLIVLEGGTSATDAFGGSAPQLPPGAAVDTGVAVPAVPAVAPAVPAVAPAVPAVAPAVPQQPVQPAPDFLNGPGTAAPAAAPPVTPKRMVNGTAWEESQLAAAGWSPEQIAALPVA